MKIKDSNIDGSFYIFLKAFNNILNKHAPLNYLSIWEEKLSLKPQITKEILNSINNKSRIYRKYIRAKEPNKKINLYNDFKSYRNLYYKILKSSKARHYQEVFETNKLNLRKTCESVRELINVKAKKEGCINRIMKN